MVSSETASKPSSIINTLTAGSLPLPGHSTSEKYLLDSLK